MWGKCWKKISKKLFYKIGELETLLWFKDALYYSLPYSLIYPILFLTSAIVTIFFKKEKSWLVLFDLLFSQRRKSTGLFFFKFYGKVDVFDPVFDIFWGGKKWNISQKGKFEILEKEFQMKYYTLFSHSKRMQSKAEKRAEPKNL